MSAPVYGVVVHKNRTRYSLTPAYLLGAYDAQSGTGRDNRFPKGSSFAQYDYGYQAELRGEHDDIDLPLEDRFK